MEKRILVVDDSEQTRKNLIEILKPFEITFKKYIAPKLLLCEFSI